jgi:hypothetical protein
LIAAATLSHYRRQVSKVVIDDKIIPRVEISESGRLEKIEKFSHYVGMYVLPILGFLSQADSE